MADVLANSMACHSRATCHIAGCCLLANLMFWSQSIAGRIQWHVIPDPRVTLQGAANWWIQWHVIPEPHATLRGAANWRIQCHNARATCHIAGCSHLANSMTLHPRTTCHIAGCCHLANSVLWSQSHVTIWRLRRSYAILKIVLHHDILFFVFLIQFGLWYVSVFISSAIDLFSSVKICQHLGLWSDGKRTFPPLDIPSHTSGSGHLPRSS